MLGARIALLRKGAGLSQRALAAALQVSPSAVGMYEQQRRTPSMELLVEMARLFDVSTDFLLTGCSKEKDAPVLQSLLRSSMEQLKGKNRALTEQENAFLLAGILQAGELTAEETDGKIEKRGENPMSDIEFMQEALLLAKEAAGEGEVPVGCVIVDGDKIVGRGRNRREMGKNALYHAELEAIDQACKTLGGWRLWRCTLYVTLEPCPMCAGAIINARIPRVVYGAKDEKAGSCGTLTDLFALPYNHKPQVSGGVMEAEAKELLQSFFKELRSNPRVKVYHRTPPFPPATEK